MGSQKHPPWQHASTGSFYFCAILSCYSSGPKTPHNLPVLFQYEDPSHNVAVFRGAELKQAIAAGLVPGFGDLGRSGKSNDGAAAPPPPTAAPYVPPPTTARYVPPPPPVPSQLELAEQACVQACRNLAGQCGHMYS